MTSERQVPFDDVPIEAVREYWDDRPCNVRHSPQPIGTRAYFDEVEARKYRVEPHIPSFAGFARWRGRRVLEVGCGIGTDTINFARNGAAVTAVELSERSLELTRQRAREYGVDDQIETFIGDAQALSALIPHRTYDLIYSFGVIHHSPDPEQIVKEMRRVASPGTTLKLMVYNRRSWKVAAIVLRYGAGRFWRWREIVAEHSEAQIGSPITYTYSPKEFVEIVNRNGFRVTDVFVDHIFQYRVRDYTQYRYVKAIPWRWLPQRFVRALEHRFGWHLCVTAVVDGASS